METFDTILCRKSTRAYPAEQISEEKLNKVILAANASPAQKGAYDNYHLTIVQKPEVFEKLEAFTDGHPYYGAPTAIIISAGQDENGELDDEDVLTIGTIEENMALAATDQGLGFAYITGAIINGLMGKQDLIDSLGIPENFIPRMGIVLGNLEDGYEKRDVPMDRIKQNFIK